MSVEAVFQMNLGVDSGLYDELMIKLERMLKVVFPLAPSRNPKKIKQVKKEHTYGPWPFQVSVVATPCRCCQDGELITRA